MMVDGKDTWDPERAGTQVFPFQDLQCFADSLPPASAAVRLLNGSRLCPVKIKEMRLRGEM